MTEPASPPSDPNPTGGPGGEPFVPPQPGYSQPGYPPPGQYPPPPGQYPPPPGYQQSGYQQSGYQQPGYGPAGYPPPGYPAPPPGYASSEDKTWALVAHFGGAAGMFFGGAVLGWVAPLIALLARGNQSPAARAHAVAALNFQVVWSIVAAIGYITLCIFIGFIILPVAGLIGVIFGIIGGVRAANNGEVYRYPMSIPMVK